MNFDLLFEEYMQAWCEANVGKLSSEEMEEKMFDLYDEWANAPCDELGGVSPKAYFAAVTDANELIKEMVQESKNGSPCALLLDRITEAACNDELESLLLSEESPEIKITAVNLLREMDSEPPYAAYVAVLADPSSDEGFAEACAEALCECANRVKDDIFAQIPDFSLERKIMALDILLNADKDERTYRLLIQLFEAGEYRSLIAGYMGKYGDERAAMLLYPALDHCPYVEYIEIRAAIEQLGGTVDDEYRDFSSDPTFKALKNLK